MPTAKQNQTQYSIVGIQYVCLSALWLRTAKRYYFLACLAMYVDAKIKSDSV